jgi:hypothetical protein
MIRVNDSQYPEIVVIDIQKGAMDGTKTKTRSDLRRKTFESIS